MEPLISGDYTSIPPVQLHRYDSKQAGYSEAKPNKTGQAGKWGGLFKSYRVGFSKQKTEEDTSDKAAGSNSEENMEDDDVVIVHNATSADNTAGKILPPFPHARFITNTRTANLHLTFSPNVCGFIAHLASVARRS